MIVSLPPLDETIPQEERLRIIDEAIEKQQRVIDELHIPLLALKSRRNASVPISRLPPEILCRIFSFVQEPELDITGRKIASLEWINLTYVCHHWRSVAANAPSMWVDPPIGNVEWVAEMLRRSKQSNLVIKIDDDRTLGMELALGDIHRVRELSMRHIGWDTWKIIERLLPVSAPRLERLCLVGQNVLTYDEEVPPLSLSISIPEDILRETGPLRQLELEYCAFNWISHSYLLSSLTHLKLHNLSHRLLKSTLDVTEKQFMDAVKSMPDLEVLDLRNAFPIFQAEQHFSQSSEVVHFPRLQTLHLQDYLTLEVKAFFRNVTFPPTAMVKVVFYESNTSWRDDDDDDDDDEPSPSFSEIILGITRLYSNLRPKLAFHSLILQQATSPNYDAGVRLKLFAEILENFDMIRHIEATPRLELVIYRATNRQEITQVLSDICSCAILDDITHLYLPENMPSLSSRTIANTLGLLPCMYSVVVATDTAKSFLDAIVLGSRFAVAVTSKRSGKLERGLSFPCLSSIFLYDVIFLVPQLVECPERAAVAISTERLRSILMHRHDFGVPIDRLFLYKCFGFFEQDKELLRKIVVDVDGGLETYHSGDETKEDDEHVE